MRIFVLLLLSGCFSIEAEIEESCLARRDVQIDGVTGSSITRAFVVDDMTDAHRLLEYDATLEFVRADVRASIDLGFVDRAAIAIEGLPVYGCDGDCPTTGDALALPAASRQNATELLAKDSLAITLEVDGALPAMDWMLDVDVCVRGTLSY